jgi:NTP pyrophosphatase (non-canonical NTP hydrolase)
MCSAFSQWLDSTYPADLDPEAHMRRRVTKVCEEAGEVHEAVGALWGENPRKPRGSLDDVIKELADCAGAALGAIEHLTGHQGHSVAIVTERVREVCDRVGLFGDKGSSS